MSRKFSDCWVKFDLQIHSEKLWVFDSSRHLTSHHVSEQAKSPCQTQLSQSMCTLCQSFNSMNAPMSFQFEEILQSSFDAAEEFLLFVIDKLYLLSSERRRSFQMSYDYWAANQLTSISKSLSRSVNVGELIEVEHEGKITSKFRFLVYTFRVLIKKSFSAVLFWRCRNSIISVLSVQSSQRPSTRPHVSINNKNPFECISYVCPNDPWHQLFELRVAFEMIPLRWFVGMKYHESDRKIEIHVNLSAPVHYNSMTGRDVAAELFLPLFDHWFA